MIFGAVILTALGTGVYLKMSGIWGMPSKEVAERITKFIDSTMLGGQGTSDLVSVKNESGLYKLTLNIEGQSYETYASKDGKYFFAQAYDVGAFMESEAKKNSEIPKAEKPDVKLFVMAYCPYGNQAEEAIIPAMKALGDSASLEMHYVIYSNYQGGGEKYCLDKENKYCSMHGIEELKQDVRELCVQKYDKPKLLDFIAKINSGTTVDNVASKWEGIAKSLGINTVKIKECADKEAENLLANEVNLNSQFKVEGSPVLVINGIEYGKDRNAEAYKNAICGAMNTPAEKCSITLDAATVEAQGDCGN